MFRTGKENFKMYLDEAHENLRRHMGGGFRDGLVLDLNDALEEIKSLKLEIKDLYTQIEKL